MNRIALGGFIALAATISLTSPSVSASRSELMSAVPGGTKTVTDWYKQDVYDRSEHSIGKIDDVLVSDGGQVRALMIGVGGFLGAGEKDVAVPFTAVKLTTKNNKQYLIMDTTKDALKAAPGFKYDSNKTVWVPDKSK
jgi:sporulation protein YlmC with PRC-barrel domain